MAIDYRGLGSGTARQLIAALTQDGRLHLGVRETGERLVRPRFSPILRSVPVRVPFRVAILRQGDSPAITSQAKEFGLEPAVSPSASRF